MNKKFITIGIVIVTLIVIVFTVFSSIFFFFYANDYGNLSKDEAQTIEAVSKGNLKICEKVSTGYVMSFRSPRADCYKAVIEKLADVNICKNKIPYIGNDNCYSIVAGATKNPELCSSITSSQIKFQCYTEVAQKSDNYEICNEIDESEEFGSEKGDCYAYFVVKTKNYSICGSLQNSRASDKCYIAYLRTNRVEADFCNFFSSYEYGKNECYKVVASQKKDPILCDNIQEKYTQMKREECVNMATNEFTY